ncbi:hypothetical protein [Cupriavidus sp. AU9028]|uniref:hypothetical protein n=1 Tax=Cupriavidus sp. AU9028 TaxID=2871157 RepID=UPI00351D6DF2
MRTRPIHTTAPLAITACLLSASLAAATPARPASAPTATGAANGAHQPDALTQMLRGAATGQNTGAAGVPELLRGSRRPDGILARACRELNDALPIDIDTETRLRRCQAVPGKHILFQLELVNYRGPMLDLASFEVSYAAPLQRNICANRDVEILTKLGISMLFRYMTRKGKGERRVGDVYINGPICTAALR